MNPARASLPFSDFNQGGIPRLAKKRLFLFLNRASIGILAIFSPEAEALLYGGSVPSIESAVVRLGESL